MRLCLAVAALVVVGVAEPARADKKLDEAVTKAEAQLAKGKEDEAVKILQKAAAQAPRDPEAPLALARLLARLGKLDESDASLGKAGELSGSAPAAVRARVLTARSSMALRMGARARPWPSPSRPSRPMAALRARPRWPARRRAWPARGPRDGGEGGEERTSSAARTSLRRRAARGAPGPGGGGRLQARLRDRASLRGRAGRLARAWPPRARRGPLSRPRAPRHRPTPFRRSPARRLARAPRPGSLGQGERGHGRRPAGRDPGAQEPAREAHPGPRVREPRTAGGSREELRGSRRPRSHVVGAARRCGRACPAPRRCRGRHRGIRGPVRRGEVVGRGPAPPRPPPPAQGGLERSEGRPRLGRGALPASPRSRPRSVPPPTTWAS
jgi:hypothetical protein